MPAPSPESDNPFQSPTSREPQGRTESKHSWTQAFFLLVFVSHLIIFLLFLLK